MIKGKSVVLRPVEERDLDIIVRWRNDPKNRRLFFTPLLLNPGGQKKWYESLLANRDKVMFMVDTLEGKTVGMLGADHIDWRSQSCEGGPILFDLDERSHGYAEEAIALFIDYVFHELNMNRMSAYLYPFNKMTELLTWFGFRQEGVMRQAVFSEGHFWDKIMMGLLREEWDNGGSDAGYAVEQRAADDEPTAVQITQRQDA